MRRVTYTGASATARLRDELRRVLREHQRRRCWTQTQLAAALRLPQPKVSEILAGRRPISVALLMDLVRRLGYDVTIHVRNKTKETP